MASTPWTGPFDLIKSRQVARLLEIGKPHIDGSPVARRSSLGEALAAARLATARDEHGAKLREVRSPSPMLGCLSYLIFLELCGKVFVPRPSGEANPTREDKRIPFAIETWADAPVPDLDLLYRLRCALAHDFSVCHSRNTSHFVFNLRFDEPVGPVVQSAAVPWAGPPHPVQPENQVIVHADALGDLAEGIRRKLLRSDVYCGSPNAATALFPYSFRYDDAVRR